MLRRSALPEEPRSVLAQAEAQARKPASLTGAASGDANAPRSLEERKPAGSQLNLVPSGWVNASRAFQYAYPFGEVPTVTLDVRGRYELELQATLEFPDEQYPEYSSSVGRLVIDGT